MNPFPQLCSVMIIDNCSTHKTEALRVVVQAARKALQFINPCFCHAWFIRMSSRLSSTILARL